MARLDPQPERLLRVGKASRRLLENWAEGVFLSQDSGISIESLVLRAASDRWVLARTHRRDGNMLMGLPQPAYRCSIGRFYYAMYHCVRAVVYIYHGGDDFEGHADLPKKVPADLSDRDDWTNRLKAARLARNAADYDPYPKSDKAWHRQASKIKSDADALLQVTRDYLRTKGCTAL